MCLATCKTQIVICIDILFVNIDGSPFHVEVSLQWLACCATAEHKPAFCGKNNFAWCNGGTFERPMAKCRTKARAGLLRLSCPVVSWNYLAHCLCIMRRCQPNVTPARKVVDQFKHLMLPRLCDKLLLGVVDSLTERTTEASIVSKHAADNCHKWQGLASSNHIGLLK